MKIKKPTIAEQGSRAVRLGLVQHACPPTADPAKNLAKAMDMIRDAAARGARIVATQELFISSYFCQIESDERFKLAQPIPGPTTKILCQLAGELNICLMASLFGETRAAGIFHNTAVMIDGTSPASGSGGGGGGGGGGRPVKRRGAGRPGKIIGMYRKMHIPDDPRFFEKYYFTPGDLGWQTQETPYGRTGVLICWDQWYPEAARLTALKGAQILFYPTAIGWYHKETLRRPPPTKKMPGKPSSVPSPSPMECSSPPSTGWASRTIWNSGAAASWPTPAE